MTVSDESARRAWVRLLAGERLTPEERATLAAHASSPQGAELRADDEMDALLRALLHADADADDFVRAVGDRLDAERDGARFTDAVARRLGHSGRRRRWSLVAGAVAAAAAVLLVPRFVRRAAPPTRSPVARVARETSAGAGVSEREPLERAPAAATLERAQGMVLLIAHGESRPALAGAPVPPGQGVLTGEGGAARVRFTDGTWLELAPGTVVAQLEDGLEDGGRGKRVLLAAGSLSAEVARQPQDRPLVFTTPQAEAAVIGTRLRLSVSPGATRVDVTTGRVRLRAHAGGAPGEVASGQYALVGAIEGFSVAEQPRGGTALFIVGTDPLRPADALVAARLTRLGFDVRRVGARAGGAEALARNAAVVLVSSTIAALDVDPWLRDLPVPVVVWEALVFDDLGMTESCDEGGCGEGPVGAAGVARPVIVKDGAHPLAAGLRGSLRVAARGPLGWGTPNLHAAWVATPAGDPAHAAIFGYERGAPMPGLPAPARRVGLFMINDTPSTMTDEGWTLFDAAVSWAAADHPR